MRRRKGMRAWPGSEQKCAGRRTPDTTASLLRIHSRSVRGPISTGRRGPHHTAAGDLSARSRGCERALNNNDAKNGDGTHFCRCVNSNTVIGMVSSRSPVRSSAPHIRERPVGHKELGRALERCNASPTVLCRLAPFAVHGFRHRKMAYRLARGFTRPGTRFRAILLVLGVSVAVGAPAAAPAGTDGQALLIAAQRGDLASVVTLLDAGVDPDSHDAVDNTALIFAARDGHPDIVRALIGGGATVNWTDAEGVTPLILAAFRGHPDVVKILLEHGADPAIRDQWGRTALDYARRRGAKDEIGRLLQRKHE